jgi:hypothetical protein
VHENLRVREAEALAGCARGEQELAHAPGQTERKVLTSFGISRIVS